MKSKKSYKIEIFLGGRMGYSNLYYPEEELYKAIKDWQESYTETPCSIYVTPTTFLFKDYFEKGWIVATTNYPPFPQRKQDLYSAMYSLGIYLGRKFSQKKITIYTPLQTRTYDV